MHTEPSLEQIKNEYHGTLTSYLLGLFASLFLTIVSFYLVWAKKLPQDALMYIIVILGITQAAVQLRLFMHLGKEAKLTATLPTGEVRILLWIKQWDFNWQDQYLFQDLLPLPKGTRLDGELVYDNSANNYRNPNTPPRRVRWGENSTDEMGSLLLNVVPRQAGDLDALRAATIGFVLTPVPLAGPGAASPRVAFPRRRHTSSASSSRKPTRSW